MKRKTSPTPTRIWTFGCLAPTSGHDRIWEQLKSAHRYYNTLIEIERWRRTQYRQLRAAVVDLVPVEAEYDAKNAEVQALWERINAVKASSRKRAVAPELRAEAKRLKEERRAIGLRRKLARDTAKTDPGLIAASTQLNLDTNARVRAARAASGLYWGTYLLVEKAIEAARKSSDDPCFRAWSHYGKVRGRIGVQIHGLLTTEALMQGDSTVLQIVPDPAPKPSVKRPMPLVRIRVGSGEGQKPIFAELPVKIHRPLPAGAAIKWAWIKIETIGQRARYELQLTLESQTFHAASRPRGTGTVALDIGWRKRPDGSVRVAYTHDERGVGREFVLPAVIHDQLAFCDSLRSHQDRWFNEAKRVLTVNKASLPLSLAESVAFSSNWRSPGKLVRLTKTWAKEAEVENALIALWRAWKTERLSQKLDLFDDFQRIASYIEHSDHKVPVLLGYLWIWERKNSHLYNWRESQRASTLARRKDIFRNWSAELARTYDTFVIEKFDLRGFAKKPAPDQEDSGAPRRHRNEASPSEFRGTLLSAVGSKRLLSEPAQNSTRDCAECGHRNAWETQAPLLLTCSGCGRTWDQDANAAKVLLQRHFGLGPSSGGAPANTPDPLAEPGKAVAAE